MAIDLTTTTTPGESGTLPDIRKTYIALISAGAVLRIISYFLSQNAGGDALARARITANWLQNFHLEFHFDVWLPLHFWMMAALSTVLGNVELSCRLLSLVLGIASIPFVWALTREVGGHGPAIFSTILFVFYSVHISYSVTSSCDVPYLFFVVAGMALFFTARRTDNVLLLVLGGLSLTLGAGIRYEAWIIIAALNVILLYRREVKRFAIFAVASSLFPVFWMIYEWLTLGNPLFAPTLNYSWVAKDLAFYGTPLLYRVMLPPGVTLIALTPLAILGLILSARQIWKQRGPLAEFAFVVLFFAAMQFYQIIAGGTMSYARYTLTLGTMTAVLGGIGLYYSFRYPTILAGVMVANLALLFVLSTVRNPFINKVRSMGPVLHFTTYLEDTGMFLKNNLGPNDAVVIDDYNYETGAIAYVAGLGLLQNERAFLIPDRVYPERQQKKFAELMPFIRSRRPTYLVYANEGELKQFLPFPSDCSSKQIEDMQFACVYQNAHYQIYKIDYAPVVAARN
ncbi:MAG TPA: glycosyltransferase family 39 protein [Pyrinomonadaceae bacterium]|nr:glycosyltransferase family 39 protein [Pyrinomonadaceae bacterium]